jgi:O-antigen ligase/polysaccharide polymerase Wzy-like membrane protein
MEPVMQKILWVLTLLLVVLMPTQHSIRVGGTTKMVERQFEEVQPDGSTKVVKRSDPKIEGGFRVTPGDALLGLVFVLWAGHVLIRFRLASVRWPLLAALVFGGLAVASALHSPELKSGVREAAQLLAYFIAGWLVFANCINTRQRLRAAADVFSMVVAVIVIIALMQYREAAANGNAFNICGTFGNRNVLGAFLSMALPFLFALGLYQERLWQKFALMLTVAVGAMVTLSGAALLALTVGILFVAAMTSRKALGAVAIAILLAVTVMPGLMLLPRHSDVVISSVQTHVFDNHLDRTAGKGEPAGEVVPAYRYTRWYAATRLIQSQAQWPYLGIGPGRFNNAVAEHYVGVERPGGDTDIVHDFNIYTAEPDSFNMYLVVAAEMGLPALVALLWLGMQLLGGNLRERVESRDRFGRALATGAAGAVIAAALCAVFSNILVRGVAMPFIFIALSGILWAKLPETSSRHSAR